MKILSNKADQVRFNEEKQHVAIKSNVEILCFRHPDKKIGWGCVEQNCPKMIMCSECNRLDQKHQIEHKDNIVEFQDFLKIIAHEISQINRDDSALFNQNIKNVLENANSLEENFDKKCKLQIKRFNTELDDCITDTIQQFTRLKSIISKFFDRQYHQYKNNILYFKAQYSQMNPEETAQRFNDPRIISSKLLMKSPHQCFTFLNNLRKSANMEGQLLSDLDYLSKQILTMNQKPEYFLPEFVLATIKQSVQDLIQSTKAITVDHLKDIPALDNQSVSHNNAISNSFISFNHNQMRINQPELFDGIKHFRFSNVGQIQTYHNNSVSALVALSEEIVATSSYDRTIKIWRISTGQLIKTIYDMNCVSCMAVLKLKNDKNPQNDTYSENDLLRLNTQLLDNPQNTISMAGILLISGGFDRMVKVWDFNLQEQSQENKNNFSSLAQSSILSQSYHLETFPMKSLQGHTSWITAITSLEDERNIVSGDDTGELIIWDIVNGVLMYKLPYVQNPSIVPFISLLIPQQQFCCSSSKILRIYRVYYSKLNQEQEFYNLKKRMSRKFLKIKEKDEIEFSGQLSNVHLYREIDIGWKIHGCLTPYNYRSQGLLIVFGGVSGKLKYVQLDKGRQIEIQGDWNSYIGHLMLIEKQKIRGEQMDQFYKNVNLICSSEKQVGIYDGYGNKLRILDCEGSEDLFSSNLLSQRNMQILKMNNQGSSRQLKMCIVSQFSSESYNYKSSRITIFEIKYDLLNY